MDYKQILLIFLYVVSTYGSSTTSSTSTTMKTTIKTTHRQQHHNHHKHPTHSSEPVEKDMFTFHYDPRSIEPLLVAKRADHCYAYSLNEEERKGVHDIHKLLILEAHVLHQVRHKAYGDWDYDDLAVRSGYFGQFCPKNGTVYYVYRL